MTCFLNPHTFIMKPHRYFYFFTIVFLLLYCGNAGAQNHSISGFVKDSATSEELIGANVYIKNTSLGVSANVYGFYSLALPVDTYEVVCSYIGYEPVSKSIYLDKDITYN